MRKFLWLFLLFPGVAFGQGARFDGVAQRTIQNFLAPIPGATITVCTSAGTGTPCTPTASIFLDAGLTQSAPNPFTADSNGNFGFWATAGTTYKYSITAAGVTGQLFTVVLPLVSGGAGTFNPINGECAVTSTATLSAANLVCTTSGTKIHIWPGAGVVSGAGLTIAAQLQVDAGSQISGSPTITGAIQAGAYQIFTGTPTVAQGNVEALWFPGANLGVQVNNAAVALNNSKANGNTKGSGKVHIQAGVYSVPLGVMNPQGEVILSCDENQAANISFTGASGIAILFNTGTLTGSYNDWGIGIENCQLSGPGAAGTGVQLGDSTHAPIGFRMNGGQIQNFGIGFNWGANSNAFGVKFDHTSFLTNTQDFIYNPNAGGGTENVELDHVVFAPSFSSVIANDVVIGPGNTTTDIWFNNCSFDNGEVVISNSSKVGFSKPHFEYGFNTTTPFLSVSGGAANVSLYSPVFQYDPSSGAVPPEAVLTTGGIVDMYTPSFVSNVASITNYLNATNSTTRVWGVATRTNTGVATYSGGSHAECPDITGACTFSLGSGNYSYSTSGTYFVNATSIIQFQGPGIDIVEGALNPQAGTVNIGEDTSHRPTVNANNTGTHFMMFGERNTATCSTGTIAVTFGTAFSSAPIVVISDQTTAGGARISTGPSNTGFTITCSGPSDVVAWIATGNPN